MDIIILYFGKIIIQSDQKYYYDLFLIQDGNKFIIFWLLDIESSSSQLKQQKIIDFISILFICILYLNNQYPYDLFLSK